MIKKILYSLWLATLTSVLMAGTIDPRNSDNQHIEYGSKHECVISIFGKQDIDGKEFFASAVIIKPKIVITAAHVVKDTKDVYIVFKDSKVKVQCAIFPKEFHDNKMNEYDIAVCLLEKSCILDFYPKLYEDDDELGKICSIAGFGMHGTYDKGITSCDNKKRAGSNRIAEISNNIMFCTLTDQKTSLEMLPAIGDSGGGLFINQKLAGINSVIYTHEKNGELNSDIKDGSGHTRISIHANWIKELIETLEKAE